MPVPLVVAASPGGLQSQIDRYQKQGVALVLIDTPPSATPAVNAALEVATSALVVTRPNLEDLEAIAETMRIAGAMGRPTGVVIWQAPADKRIRVVGLAREYLKTCGIQACPTAITSSVGYPYAYSENLTVQERDPDGRARAELAELWAWLQRDGIIRP